MLHLAAGLERGALDVKIGKPVWRTQLGNINIGESCLRRQLGR